MGDPTAPTDTMVDEDTLIVADELGKLAYGLAAAAAALNGPGEDDPGYGGWSPDDVADGLRGAAAAADQLGRIAYANAYNADRPDPRVAPGYFAERIYGPDVDDVGRHAAPTPGAPDAPVPFDGEAARAARAVIDAAMGTRGRPDQRREMIARLRKDPDGRIALVLFAEHFARGGVA